MFREEQMAKKVVDLMLYRIEKSLKENGYVIKKDSDHKIKVFMRLNGRKTKENW